MEPWTLVKRWNLSTFAGFAAILLWSTTVALVRSLSEQLGPISAAAAVYLIGGVFCLVRLWWGRAASNNFTGGSFTRLAGCGLVFVLYTAALFFAIGMAKDRQQVVEIGLVNYLWPAATIWFSLVMLRQRVGLLLIPGTLMALGGIWIVMTQGAEVSWRSFLVHLQSNPAAYGMALTAALSWAFYSNLTRLWGSQGAVEIFIPVTGVVLFALRFVAGEHWVWSGRALIEATVLGGITALAYVLWDVAMRKGDLLVVAAGAYFTPLLSTVVTCIYLGVL